MGHPGLKLTKIRGNSQYKSLFNYIVTYVHSIFLVGKGSDHLWGGSHLEYIIYTLIFIVLPG